MSTRQLRTDPPADPAAVLDISLIICTRNRAAFLPAHLQSLTGLITDTLQCEIIIVDNGSTDATGELLAAFAGSRPGLVRLVREPLPGLARARNAGYKAARGRLVVFTDDDCYPEPNFLEQIVHALDTNGWDYMGGRVNLFDPLDAPITIKTDTEKFEIRAGSHIEAGVMHGANFSFKRSVLEFLGGFDARFGAGAPLISGEDMDIIARASAAGFCGGYDPRPIVAHHHRRRDQREIDKLNVGYDVGRGAYYAKMLLVKEVRWIYARHWYWRFRMFALSGKIGRIYSETSGATRFLASELLLRCKAQFR